jgi:hypothetical protein
MLKKLRADLKDISAAIASLEGLARMRARQQERRRKKDAGTALLENSREQSSHSGGP